MSEAEKIEGAGQEPNADAPNADVATSGTGDAPAPTAITPAPTYRPSYAFLIIVAGLNLAADLGSKAWAVNNLGTGKAVDVFDGWLRFVLAHNPGGAWGLLQDESAAVRRPFFVIVSIVAIGFIVSLYRKLAPDQTALKWGLPLVLGGALGNLVDRIRYGHVIDFIDMYTRDGTWIESIIEKILGPLRGYHWPTYNVADIAIVFGVLLMAVDMFTSRKTEKKAEAAKKADEAPPAS